MELPAVPGQHRRGRIDLHELRRHHAVGRELVLPARASLAGGSASSRLYAERAARALNRALLAPLPWLARKMIGLARPTYAQAAIITFRSARYAYCPQLHGVSSGKPIRRISNALAPCAK